MNTSEDVDSTVEADENREVGVRNAVVTTVDVDLDTDELLQIARNASNGTKFDRLWNGNTAGYDSQSEADMALCCLLAFWTGADQAWMDQLFRQSGLLREKWDEVHYADGSTYGEKTIKRAVANTSEFYTPKSGKKSAQTSTTTGGLSAGAGNDNSERTQAYVTEKNRLLTDRVANLEATLDQKDERIATLEAEVDRLKAELADQSRKLQPTSEGPAVNASADDEGEETVSMWAQTKRLFQRGFE